MNLVGKGTIHRRKNIFTDANLRKQQREQHTQVSLCVYVQNLHQGNGEFKCKGQGSHKWT